MSSIALEELGLSHIINSEGEKLQYVLGTLPGVSTTFQPSITDLLTINTSVRDTINVIGKKERILNEKLENVLGIDVTRGPTGVAGSTGATGVTGPTGSNGANVPYDTITTQVGSNIALDTGSGGATGTIHVAGGHVYKVIYNVGATINSRTFNLNFNGSPVQGTQTQVSSNANTPFTSSAIIEVPPGPSGTFTVTNANETGFRIPQCGITVIMYK
ncbi:hypothetical protein [Thermoactinomyces sp. DSM 45892]|uniref:hypothetical protein n=1 Tax=Thermoactinomyces sp. DSM 45892 TaxID=1882753 RepID=UPI00089C1E07|nr:hypothetical protein [Thermoactinomyces sp. DSM 45892]SDY04145.1 hypothetical protein SAMN05444416_101311 [Thermoactinomyces sp. DSM 45892]